MQVRGFSYEDRFNFPRKSHGVGAVAFCFDYEARHTSAGAWDSFSLGEI
jgi:hypothetical protein